ncbi:MAG: glycosyltransferase family 2 protein [Ruminococcaceae bacterium]|nr:glycosyltransferase family 2 protein [Oscillospiraceae bacterium]
MEKTSKEIFAEGASDYGLVSVIMPCYNSAEYIAASIDSVVSQTYKNWELIIVDDCSTDNSTEIIENYGDDRIVLLRNEKNSGAAITRNNGIDIAKGRWIAFLDSDDLWHPEKLEKQLKFMSEKQCAFSFTHYYFDRGAEGIREFSPEKDEYTYKDILKHCYIACPTVIYDVTALGKVYMPTDAIKREDFGCWLSILRRGVNAHCLHESLLTVKIHEGSVSYNKTKMIKYQWNVYRKVEKISFFATCYYMMHWAIKGFLKYR